MVFKLSSNGMYLLLFLTSVSLVYPFHKVIRFYIRLISLPPLWFIRTSVNLSFPRRILNPKHNTIVECEWHHPSCDIVCDEPNACSDSTFELHSARVHVECSGTDSCQSLSITTNSTSFYLHLSGHGAFLYGLLHHNGRSANIITECLHSLCM